jgi:UDP-N-acetylglucosamine 2-epimerase (non-hydrolysing)
MKAIIPVAGIGTRLRPHTHTQPKALIPIAGKPILAHITENLIEAGIKDFVFVIGYLGDKIEQYILQHYPQINAQFVIQTTGKGVGHAIWLAKSCIHAGEEILIVFGDTNSTAAASIVAAKLNIKLAHIEAGLREFDKSIPEETNKLITDILTDFYFCPTDTGVSILKSMGITNNVFNVGDVMIDLIEENRIKIESETKILSEFNLTKKDYVFATIHRASNTDNSENLKEILNALSQIKQKIVFPIHPRTYSIIQNLGLSASLKSDNIIITEPLGYFDTQTLIHYAKFILTDSGGVTKEAYYHKTQAILLDKQTEWIETVNEGWNIQAGPNEKNILNAILSLKMPESQSSFLGSGDASKKISYILHDKLY